MNSSSDRYVEQVRKLCTVSLERLPHMVEPHSGLVVCRVDGNDLIPAGTSVRYTAMSSSTAGTAPSPQRIDCASFRPIQSNPDRLASYRPGHGAALTAAVAMGAFRIGGWEVQALR